MRFQLTEDQRALREGVRGLLAARFGRERLRAAVEGAGGVAGVPELDRGLWRELGTAGFFSLRLPDKLWRALRELLPAGLQAWLKQVQIDKVRRAHAPGWVWSASSRCSTRSSTSRMPPTRCRCRRSPERSGSRT